jgi:exopolysaccharide biosynthesis polyprenyl glycosylphosphotransferase
MYRPSKVFTLFVYQIADLVVVAIALTALYAANVAAYTTETVEHFLAARITIRNALLAGCFLLFWNLACRGAGLYNPAHLPLRKAAPRVAAACFVGALAALIFPLSSGSGQFSYALVFWFWLLITAALLGMRFAAEALRKFTRPMRQILVVGTGPLAAKVVEELRSAPEKSNIIGFVDNRGRDAVPARFRASFLGHIDNLDAIVMHRVVDEVVIALPVKSCYDSIQRVIEACERVGVAAAFSCDLFECTRAKPSVPDPTEAGPMVHLAVAANDERLIVKRCLDLCLAAAALICLAPLMLAVAVLVKLTSRGPVLFMQERYGLNKRRFRMLKFRTMVVNAEALQAKLEDKNEIAGPAFKIRNDPRITPLGRILRKTSLDELPQLINVLAGDMSLVGPRPMSVRDVSRFDALAHATLQRAPRPHMSLADRR